MLERFEVLSVSGQDLTRWSARLLAATFLLSELEPAEEKVGNVFDSLASKLRDAAVCSSTAPRWLPIAALIVSLFLLRGALWTAVGLGMFGARDAPVADHRRDMRNLRGEIALLWNTPAFRWLRWGLLSAVWILAVGSGLASVAFAALVLTQVSSSLLVWPLIVCVSVAITNTERGVIHARFALFREPPPSPAEAKRRLARYLAEYPEEAESALPLAYAYSGLDRAEISQRFAELSTTGGLGRVTWIGTIVLVAAIFPYLPVPNVENVGNEGFVDCVYADTYGFFDVAEANLLVSVGAALLLIAATPVLVLHTVHRFMAEWRAPMAVRLEAMRRERRRFAARMRPYAMLIALAGSVIEMTILWASAELATRLSSAAAGLSVIIALNCALIAAARVGLRRITATL